MKTTRTASLGARLAQLRNEVSIRTKRPDWTLVVSDDLPFGQLAEGRFLRAADEASSYLEYGSGSSTLRAASVVPACVSVESDPDFLAAVEARCGLPADHQTLHFIHANVGHTGAWGVPTMRRPTRSRIKKWLAYPMAPWLELGLDYRADTILVDGRFRVACGLAVVLMQPDREWTLFFDDYAERPEYWGFEAFAERVALHGRMAEFRPRENANLAGAQLAFNDYLRDWR